MKTDKKRIVVSITGASGAQYGISLVEALAKMDYEIPLIVSNAGQQVMFEETGKRARDLLRPGVTLFEQDEITAPMASGSFPSDGMVILPCTMATLAAVAHGHASTLILRAADVTLKEGRPLILVPRETPLNRIHLENMLKAHNAGAVIMPAMPSFYGKPSSIEELVSHTVGRILNRLGIENDLAIRWEGLEKQP